LLVSCSYCGGSHPRGSHCSKRPKRVKDTNYITRFRSSAQWQKKRAEIRARDKELCQICLLEGRYTFKNLEVHHIERIVLSWERRLDNGNLVTLCNQCHEKAENGKIDAALLYDLAQTWHKRL
jgi:5-methylcytosine-specific restriction protein A